MLDFHAPNGYKVRCYAGDTVYVSDPITDKVVGCYTPRHGEVVYPATSPQITVEVFEALKHGRNFLFAREQVLS